MTDKRFLIRGSSLRIWNGLFLIKESGTRIRNGPPLFGGGSLQIRNGPFLIRESETRVRNELFLIRGRALQIRNSSSYCAGTQVCICEVSLRLNASPTGSTFHGRKITKNFRERCIFRPSSLLLCLEKTFSI